MIRYMKPRPHENPALAAYAALVVPISVPGSLASPPLARC